MRDLDSTLLNDEVFSKGEDYLKRDDVLRSSVYDRALLVQQQAPGEAEANVVRKAMVNSLGAFYHVLENGKPLPFLSIFDVAEVFQDFQEKGCTKACSDFLASLRSSDADVFNRVADYVMEYCKSNSCDSLSELARNETLTAAIIMYLAVSRYSEK